MKQCPKCQANISDTAKFCMECGCNIKKYEEEQAKPKTRFCPECGTEIPRGSFCPECGYNLGNALNGEATSATIDTFGDDWLSEFESSSNADVATMRAQKSKEQMEKALSAFEYEVHSDGTYTIISLKDKNLLKVIIPERVEAIGDNAFEGSEIISVSLPEGILKIGNRSFAKCAFLDSITLPDSLMFVGDEAFADCEMLNIKFPTTIKKLGKDALKNTATDNRRIQAEADEAKRLSEEKRQKELADAKKKKDAERKKAEEELKQAKEDAAAELNAYVDKTKYRKAQIVEIDQILKAILPLINNATMITMVKVFTNDGKKALDKVKTDAVMTAEEKQKAETAEKKRKAAEEKRKAEEEAKHKAKEEAEKRQRTEAEARLRAEYQALFDQQEKDCLQYAKYQCEQLKKKEMKTLSLGSWPQSEADPNALIEDLQDENGYYCGKDANGKAAKFAKINGKYYKVESILWERVNFGFLDEFIPIRILDCMRYDKSSGSYGQSEILSWLNGEFYQKAFTEWEKRMLLPNDALKQFVNLLNDYDMNKLDNPIKAPSAYAKARGAYTHYEDGKGGYWLHSSQYEKTQEALELDHNGVIYRCNVTRGDLGVVPYILMSPWKI